MADKEYSSTDAAHGLPGFSSSKQWEEVQETGIWSHYPIQPGPKAGFHNPVEAGPQRKQLWTDQNEPDAPDDAQGWAAAYSEKGGLSGKATPSGQGRTSGTERGNSPWFKGGPH